MPTTFSELLPATRTTPRGAGFKWTPSEDHLGCGMLVIEAPRVRVTYHVVPIATKWAGKAWHLAKTDAGTDKDSESYDCFLGINPHERSCTCKGYCFGRNRDERGRVSCKHLEALIGITANRWDECPVNLDTDTGRSEVEDQPEQF